MSKRRRFKQSKSLKERLSEFAADAVAKMEGLPPGAEREALQKKIRQADIAANLEVWANSPELQPPK